jgi:predicted ATP-binding protein involved in virulence
MLHLEEEGFITKYPNIKNIEVPLYLITYSGIILVKNGGYSKKLVLDRLKEILQRFAWFVTILTLLLNLYVNKDKLISSDTSTNQKTEVKASPQKETKMPKK